MSHSESKSYGQTRSLKSNGLLPFSHLTDSFLKTKRRYRVNDRSRIGKSDWNVLHDKGILADDAILKLRSTTCSG